MCRQPSYEWYRKALELATGGDHPKAPRPPPRHGEHTREVLAEYGFSDADIAQVT